MMLPHHVIVEPAALHGEDGCARAARGDVLALDIDGVTTPIDLSFATAVKFSERAHPGLVVASRLVDATAGARPTAAVTRMPYHALITPLRRSPAQHQTRLCALLLEPRSPLVEQPLERGLQLGVPLEGQ